MPSTECTGDGDAANVKGIKNTKTKAIEAKAIDKIFFSLSPRQT
ncbi:MAG: hypothetical protein WCB90_04030 [Methanosarcina sp.]